MRRLRTWTKVITRFCRKACVPGKQTCLTNRKADLLLIEHLDRWVLEEDGWQGKWAWTRQPSGRAVGDLTKLVSDLNGLTLDESQEDKWERGLDLLLRKFTSRFVVSCLFFQRVTLMMYLAPVSLETHGCIEEEVFVLGV
ncbi:hypothetical protein Tco_1386829 [Tanacetum coccineum]